ncbi:hypothetical protein MPTK1_7g06870 [Marchantia polymorpha subsp. ruderalis]|uniref:Uncharacterized protein n=2 Tax=Marchantia polymorpha TaxID=3197 RepID=A0AAF6BWW7_MARPO|nr:hypothetical protein MARPO_0199s0005 [Marchantia polymorpha]BBN16501.1 hypothetical protein Mp_7g06870 [Marchantia polymorpha subsp. ruderalis]|eukprot:PTQ27415.1 hypothetical protein MARPO_0199s0005 [Marchantia polymorpha]
MTTESLPLTVLLQLVCSLKYSRRIRLLHLMNLTSPLDLLNLCFSMFLLGTLCLIFSIMELMMKRLSLAFPLVTRLTSSAMLHLFVRNSGQSLALRIEHRLNLRLNSQNTPYPAVEDESPTRSLQHSGRESIRGKQSVMHRRDSSVGSRHVAALVHDLSIALHI